MAGPLIAQIPGDWRTALESASRSGDSASSLFENPASCSLDPNLASYVEAEYAAGAVYPPRERLFAALAATPLANVRAVIVGQDPYHGSGQAHGLCFSVAPGVAVPPSLRNILLELRDDLGYVPPRHGCLTAWAKQGVLLFNTVLTVRAGEPQSHAGRGWERFSDAILSVVAAKPERVVFLLWGKPAQTKRKLVDRSPHVVLAAAHPSPLAARNGFFGSRPFSKTNAALIEAGREPIDWKLPEVVSLDT